MELSTRLQDVKEYYFSRKLKEVAALRESGRDIISLAIGSPDLSPHESVISALSKTAAMSDSHGYQPYHGIDSLRTALSKFYKNTYDVDLSPKNQILPLMGSKEGILHLTMAFCNPTDAVLVPNPGYAAYSSIAKLLNVSCCNYNLTENRGWVPDISELQSLVDNYNETNANKKGRVKILWINYPNMPTGSSGSPQALSDLIQFSERNTIILVNDNPYSLVLPHGSPLSIMSNTKSNFVIELNSLSKSHCMAGWRIGCLVSRNADLVKAALQIKSNFDSGMFKGLQVAAATALTEVPKSFFERVNKEYEIRRHFVYQILTVLKCSFSRTQVGMFVWAKAPDSWSSVEDKLDNLLHSTGVFLTPGSVFGTNGARYVRASLCCPVPRLEEALHRLQKHFVPSSL
eukprot:TRINITY_DN17020_c0_g1_i1.p1 TRINITY_DN17020_c0_g1~~TRINITY_DN17020_c0_g1_i1.p1  ORF type:complete len:413 (+),score=68.59 TRINITY_DN17020_c0_g1_i1:35-1240(+)